ncbi:GMC family oxidoreductase [Paracoccus sp. IB05]|uniref:GMC family oxidoreductase n=1 Tax=Paracoccus sp. IB05 TaxID=2779367 RepID=UPI0018E750D4|nr:GMC oxidoreductase [Paracoccus sp. IB05]MBJ2150238.1 GMC family oxidoreductase N-terminal domain-containing protein [Paracoccus sp. IB05]
MEFDYIVVGGGAAGAVAARRLAELTTGRVALLETGPDASALPQVRDFRRFKELTDSPLAPYLPIEPPPVGNDRFRYPVARMLGGSTSQNTCIWFRAPDSDFQDWEQAGATGWGPGAVRDHYAALESRIHIETVQPEGPPHDALIRASRETGFDRVDFATPFGAGFGSYRMSKRGEVRESTARVFLLPESSRPANLAVFTDTPVTGLLFGEGMQVTGVSTPRGPFRATREVILSAGALDTPRLLMLSGIGPAAHLRDHGITPRLDLPGVGAHLLDHPAAGLNFASRVPITRDAMWNYTGVLFANVENDTPPWPDIEIQIGAETFEQQTAPAGYPGAAHGFASYMTVNRARSEGSVRLASADPFATARIDPAYFTDPDGYDMRVMLGGIRLSRRLFASPAMKDLVGRELAPGIGAQDEASLVAYIRETATTGYHPGGTCRMGAASDTRSVTDPSLRVCGVRGLRVADASVMPTMVSINIAATCMMIGHKAAQMIAGQA